MIPHIDRGKVIKTPLNLLKAKVVILGVPFVSKHFGNLPDSKNAPRAVREFFDYFYDFDLEENKSIYELPFYDAGDIIVSKSYEKTKKIVKEVIEKIRKVNPNAKFVFIGGDHLITPMITDALKPKSLLSLDAHLDLLEYAPDFEHACAMNRVFKVCKNIKIHGYRDVAKEEIEFAKRNGIRISRNLNFRGRIDYLSIDIDVLDYIYASSSSPVPLGFSPQDIIKLIQRTKFNFVDIVEWSPPHGFPAIIKILREILFKISKD